MSQSKQSQGMKYWQEQLLAGSAVNFTVQGESLNCDLATLKPLNMNIYMTFDNTACLSGAY